MRLLFALLTAISLLNSLNAAEWPQFRGPTGDGHADAADLATAWSESEHIAWKAEIAGKGWSSPAIADGVAWMTSAIVTKLDPAEEEKLKQAKLAGNPIAGQMEINGPVKLFAVAVDVATGKVIKQIDLFDVADPPAIHSLNSYASPSPIVAAGRVYAHFGSFGTACINAKSGEVLWRQQVKIDHSVGPGSSPVLYENLLIIPSDGTDAQFVNALNVKTGEQVWRTARPPMTGGQGDLHKAFSTPLLIEHKGAAQVIVPGAQWFVSYEPKTGKEIWRVRHGDGFSNVPCPVFADGVAYLCTGFMTPELWAVRIDGHGDVTESHVLWKNKRQVPTMSSPIVIETEVYFNSEQGVLTCLDAKSGEQVWQKRLKGNYSASPLYADGKLYFCSREGLTTVLQAGREYEPIAENQLSGQLLASPAVIAQTLFLRSDAHLYRIDKAATLGSAR